MQRENNMKQLLYIIAVFALTQSSLISQTKEETKTLLIRCDDMGMSHAVNMAFKELMESDLKFSASVLFVCNWYQEAVEILKQHPEIPVGVHLALNAEWKNYRWGPAAGRDVVKSLVDEEGYFFSSQDKLFANNPKTEEVEIELRAQIERAIKSGIKISYLDFHMGTAISKPEYIVIVKKLAEEFKLGLSGFLGEVFIEPMYSVDVNKKKVFLIEQCKNLKSGQTNFLLCHIGKDQPELQAMIDLNDFGLPEMSKHREAELNALIYAKQNNIFESNGIRLIDYSELIKDTGTGNFKSGNNSGY